MIAIDLGSNTLRVVKRDCEKKEYIGDYEKIVRTADGLIDTGTISHAAIVRVIDAINEAKEKIDFDDFPLRAVTTEAIRSAKNSEEVLVRIKEETGINFEIISGEEEARFTLLAVKYRLSRLHYASKNFVLADIGGGSTELIFYHDGEVVSRSFPIGILTMAQTYRDLETMQNALPDDLFPMEMFCTEMFATKGEINSFVATAGIPTTVAAIKLGQIYATYDASRVNGTMLEADELDFYLKKLLAMPLEQREEAVGTGRSDLIAAGILIFKHIFRLLSCHNCIVVDDGLREGIALQECKE
ncbi:MAG: phosphatase [Sulfurimonas sp.]